MGVAGAGGLGIAGTLAVLAIGYFFGVDVTPIVRGLEQGQPGQTGPLSAEDQEWGDFVSVVLADTESVWTPVLPQQAGIEYAEPTLVLYSGVVQSACGSASSAMGPFYCPNDQQVYLDTDFFNLMAGRMGAGGDFAYAYVIAHEVGHHIQNLTGTLAKTNRVRQQGSEREANQISVLTELQADCYAGIWARQAQDRFGTIEAGDLEEATAAARAVGDDVIQANAGRTPVPDSFTHGSAQQRRDWLMRGFESGDIAQCDTFRAAGL